jgi:hypothetical protein
MCVIIYTKINGKQFLVKNRDRTYNPKIEIIHEILNGIEVVYINDLITGWREGMNELGFGLVNSSLSTSHDDNKSIHAQIKKNPKLLHDYKTKIKGNAIFNILIDREFEKKIYDCLKHDNCSNIAEGHNLIVTKHDVFHVEKFKDKDVNDFFINKLNDNSNIVFTNHSIHGSGGYTKGHSGLSSFLRKEIVDSELKHNKINSIDDLLTIINTNYVNIDPRFHPYRDSNISKTFSKYKNAKYVSTNAQLIFNMTDKIFSYFPDTHHDKYVKYINRLPNNYTPKIQVHIHNTQKNMMRKKRVFTQSYLNKIYKRFHYKTRKHNTISHKKTRKHNTHFHKKTRKRLY